MKDVHADVAVRADVRVEYFCQEGHERRSEGVPNWELDVEVEDAPFVGTPHGSGDGGMPMGIG